MTIQYSAVSLLTLMAFVSLAAGNNVSVTEKNKQSPLQTWQQELLAQAPIKTYMANSHL